MVSKVIKKYGKSKSFYWWIGSYVIILILAVALNSIGYFVTLRVLSAEIEKNNSNQIANINIVCDDKFSEILNSTYTLLHINSVERMEREEYSHDAITIGNVSSAISNNVTVYKEVENCAIIYRDRDICFHSDFGKASLSQIYRAYFRGWFDSEDAWLNRAFSVSGSEFFTILSGGEQGFFLIYRIPIYNDDISVMVKINSAQMAHILQDTDNDLSLITDRSGNVVVAGSIGMSLAKIEDPENPRQWINGREYFVSSCDSRVIPFKYIHLITAETYLKSVKSVHRAFIIGYLLCVLIAGGLTWWFSVINEKNKQRLDVELERHGKYIREDKLRRAMEGKIKLTKQEFAEEYDFKENRFVTLLFDFIAPLDPDGEPLPLNYRSLCDNIAESFDRNYPFSGLWFVMNEMCIGILGMGSESEVKQAHDLLETVNNVCDAFSADIALSVYCGVSQIMDDPKRLNECYDQVIEVSTRWLIEEGKSVLLYDEVEKDDPAEYGLLANRDELIVLLTAGDSEQAWEMMLNAFNDVEKETTLRLKRVWVLNMVTILLQAAAQIDLEGEINFRDLYQNCVQINNPQQMKKAKQVIHSYTEEICKLSRRQNAVNESNMKYQNIVDYIDTHYTDSDLNVNMLAEVFQISRSWISKNFKENMGISPSDYIVKRRIQKAKELLRTDKTVAEIALEVGFCNERVYCRTFKKYTNITSQQYRQMLNAENSNE